MGILNLLTSNLIMHSKQDLLEDALRAVQIQMANSQQLEAIHGKKEAC